MPLRSHLRSPFLWLLALNLAAWQLAGLWIRAEGLVVFSFDDATRAMLAQVWSADPFLWPDDAQWLPLPFAFYGMWFRLVQGFEWTYWYVPAAGAMIGLGAAMIGWTGLILARTAGLRAADPRSDCRLAVCLALALPLMIRDNWRVAASPLSEPPFLMLLAAAILLAVRLAAERPCRRLPWVGLALILSAFQMTRYEAIPLAYVIWTVAWACGRPIGQTRRRGVVLLLSGWIALALFPIAWLVVNHVVRGDVLEFVDVTKRHAIEFTELSDLSTARRVRRVLGWMRRQGTSVILLAIVGVWLGRRLRAAWPVLAALACAWCMNIAMALSNSIGSTSPSRFTLLFLWICVPLALLALLRLVEWKRPLRLAIPVAMALLAAAEWNHWSRSGWGGEPVGGDLKVSLESLGDLTRRDRYTIVVEEYEDFGLLNNLRLACGAERVTFPHQYSTDHPIHGRFLYLYPPRDDLRDRNVGRAFGFDIALIDRMPLDAPNADAGAR
jgi:hypothetical protein